MRLDESAYGAATRKESAFANLTLIASLDMGKKGGRRCVEDGGQGRNGKCRGMFSAPSSLLPDSIVATRLVVCYASKSTGP